MESGGPGGAAGLRWGPRQPASKVDLGCIPPVVHARALSFQIKSALATWGPSLMVQGTKRDFRGWVIKVVTASARAQSQAISCGRRQPPAMRMLKQPRGEGWGF